MKLVAADEEEVISFVMPSSSASEANDHHASGGSFPNTNNLRDAADSAAAAEDEEEDRDRLVKFGVSSLKRVGLLLFILLGLLSVFDDVWDVLMNDVLASHKIQQQDTISEKSGYDDDNYYNDTDSDDDVNITGTNNSNMTTLNVTTSTSNPTTIPAVTHAPQDVLSTTEAAAKSGGDDVPLAPLQNENDEAVLIAHEEFLLNRQDALDAFNKLQEDMAPEFQDLLRAKEAPVLTLAIQNYKKSILQVNFNLRKPGYHKDLSLDWTDVVPYYCYEENPNDTQNNITLAVDNNKATKPRIWKKTFRPTMNSLIMECPLSTKFLLADQTKSLTKTKTSHLLYDLRPFLAVEEKFDWMLPHPKPNSSPATLAACTMVDKQNEGLIPQWIEYNRLLGFDQIWIYYNDPWGTVPQRLETYMSRPDVQEYASLIPFIWDNEKDFHYQITQQEDCLAHARKKNITWMFLADVDEYLQLLDKELTLKEYLEVFESQKVSGIQVQNFFWGGPGNKPPSYKSVIRDNTYRTEESTGKRARVKTIARAEFVEHMNVHWADSTVEPYHPYGPEPEEIRHCHFKKQKFDTPVLDTSLRDQWADKLEQRLHEVEWI